MANNLSRKILLLYIIFNTNILKIIGGQPKNANDKMKMQQQVDNLENLLSSLVKLKTKKCEQQCNSNNINVKVEPKPEVKVTTVKIEPQKQENNLNKAAVISAVITTLSPTIQKQDSIQWVTTNTHIKDSVLGFVWENVGRHVCRAKVDSNYLPGRHNSDSNTCNVPSQKLVKEVVPYEALIAKNTSWIPIEAKHFKVPPNAVYGGYIINKRKENVTVYIGLCKMAKFFTPPVMLGYINPESKSLVFLHGGIEGKETSKFFILVNNLP